MGSLLQDICDMYADDELVVELAETVIEEIDIVEQ